MERILISGASGNVGQAILQHFAPTQGQVLYIASRKKHIADSNLLYFDFDDPEGAAPSFEKVDTLFLLRPPHISDVKAHFLPLIAKAKDKGVSHIVFLSVQGAESISFIPHAKIEKLIVESGLSYTFIRPSYFMQNLTTTLADGIRNNNSIYLPAGDAPFLWIDVADIGKAIAAVLGNTKEHRNKAYTITGNDLLNFGEVAGMLSAALGRNIAFISPSPLMFFLRKRKEGLPIAYILVMIMLHYIPRFQKPPRISNDLAELTREAPNSIADFIKKHAEVWKSPLNLPAQLDL
jgi:uncharacterized protein YbjT (DUF2867 family)